MALSPREIAPIGLRDHYPEDDFPTRQLAPTSQRAFKHRDRQRTRAEIATALAYDTHADDTKDS
ncbi:hypothetical protein J2Z21_009361 [Streptomyces griseochromogenes]|uniref:Uncharacterized protein n=1 Tax=Streptomyces griseochromogenes TaxID=68214 RepID=A0A1B1B4D0_9ACTN|nr:hypothetical protein [Streptomyces griseochromogenes]ANP53675.1 hypothetical protein AVL59_32690 [Streptomyces griseochromogenes]MBP2056343.1 hypothetical protein [Streptomyces griseochromogenes]